MSETNSTTCPRAEIAAYLDGELTSQAETEFERHLAGCPACTERLNEQKRLLCALDFAFDDEKKIELPKDFARAVAVRAEANFSGLRDKNERMRAVLLTVTLAASGLAIVLLGSGSDVLLRVLNGFWKQIFAVAHVILGFCYDFGVVAVVILRAASRQFFVSPFAGWVFVGLVVFSFFALSRLLTKYHRAGQS